jgi:hypothetical protein
VCQKQGFEVDNLFAKLRDGSRKSIILRAKDLNLGLQISKPLLLTLATLESSDPMILLDTVVV